MHLTGRGLMFEFHQHRETKARSRLEECAVPPWAGVSRSHSCPCFQQTPEQFIAGTRGLPLAADPASPERRVTGVLARSGACNRPQSEEAGSYESEPFTSSHRAIIFPSDEGSWRYLNSVRSWAGRSTSGVKLIAVLE